MEQQDAKKKIAELRTRYAKLMSVCGRNAISKQIIDSYKQEIAELESFF